MVSFFVVASLVSCCFLCFSCFVSWFGEVKLQTQPGFTPSGPKPAFLAAFGWSTLIKGKKQRKQKKCLLKSNKSQ